MKGNDNIEGEMKRNDNIEEEGKGTKKRGTKRTK
jgi:hypothetical protein